MPPHTACPPCPACGSTVATPCEHAPEPQRYTEHPSITRADLWCPACGHGWREADAAKVEKAWRAWRAWERCRG